MATEAGLDGPLDATVGYLIKALRAVGRSGDPDAANRLAAQAWLRLRDVDPRQAERINGAMHYLARLPRQRGPIRPVHQPPRRNHEQRPQTRRAQRPAAASPRADPAELPRPGVGQGLRTGQRPRPEALWYQFDAEFKNQFTWDYLEQGPTVWRVRIGKPEA
nr:DUF2249 domain-containing protein [Tessaracoccus coleopterorum]